MTQPSVRRAKGADAGVCCRIKEWLRELDLNQRPPARSPAVFAGLAKKRQPGLSGSGNMQEVPKKENGSGVGFEPTTSGPEPCRLCRPRKKTSARFVGLRDTCREVPKKENGCGGWI